MMIQPVVENCIRHGIKPLETRKGMITVHFKRINKLIACTITDNGVGRSSISESKVSFTEHKSYGIDIVRKRLEVFAENNTEESGIEIIDLFDDNENPAGTQVILNLPYKNII
jgi:LytS/YehU family sensor histidine kinase